MTNSSVDNYQNSEKRENLLNLAYVSQHLNQTLSNTTASKNQQVPTSSDTNTVIRKVTETSVAALERLEQLSYYNQLSSKTLKSYWLDPRDFLNNIYQSFQTKTRKPGVEFLLDIADFIPSCVYCDPQSLEEAISKLLTNAIEHTNNGYVRLGACIDDHNHLIIFIEDTGIGIAKEDQSKIFDPFLRNPSINKKLGLGLAIAEQLVQLHDGKIYLQSEIGEGTCIAIILPMH